jgi:hypothetical protein
MSWCNQISNIELSYKKLCERFINLWTMYDHTLLKLSSFSKEISSILLHGEFPRSTRLNTFMNLLQQAVMQLCFTHTFSQRWLDQHFSLLLCHTGIAKYDPHAVQMSNQRHHCPRNTGPTKSISNHIGLFRVILNCKVIILYQLKSSTLSHIQLLLCENIFETLMISIDITNLTIEVVPPRL